MTSWVHWVEIAGCDPFRGSHTGRRTPSVPSCAEYRPASQPAAAESVGCWSFLDPRCWAPMLNAGNRSVDWVPGSSTASPCWLQVPAITNAGNVCEHALISSTWDEKWLHEGWLPQTDRASAFASWNFCHGRIAVLDPVKNFLSSGFDHHAKFGFFAFPTKWASVGGPRDLRYAGTPTPWDGGVGNP